jgi:glycosyltransferase involved in cell wall biosynthesis
MFYIDIRPLMDRAFTGIPQLTWHIAQYWLARSGEEPRFFVGNVEIERLAVEKIVEQRTGRYFEGLRRSGDHPMYPISADQAKHSIALYPHTRPTREKIFGREIQIIHDLTSLLTPEFHPDELLISESRRFLYDFPQIDHFICVSEASRDDLVQYSGINPALTSVAYPGVGWFDSHFTVYEQISQSTFEPYVLILGTFEPRKNLEIVFEYILKHPSILDSFVFCFCGAEGWGGVYERCRNNPRIVSFIKANRIRIIPFVNERLKYALMKEASFLIYPSFLEGFGSPVAEALSVGVPVVVSIGGSLPEVAGDVGYYFDPYSLEGMDDAIQRVIVDLTYRNAETRMAAYRQGSRFTWSAFNDNVRNVVEDVASRAGIELYGRADGTY